MNCATLWLSAVVAFGSAGPRIVNLRIGAKVVRQYERLVVTFRLDRTYDNPYDPTEVAAECLLTGPDGGKLTVPCFWHVPHEPADDFTAHHVFTDPGREMYRQAGPGRWEARLALLVPGLWRGRIRVRDREGESLSAPFSIRCLPGKTGAHGYLRPARNGWFLQFDDGTGFVPIGFCIAWARGNDEHDCYDYYLARLGQAGGNTVRVWLCHWAWLEWTRGKKGALRGYQGVGRYNQQVAFNFDRLVELAERTGIYLQICLNNACWEFGRPDGKHDAYDSWGGNPYNAKNGGPCQRPGEFWTNPEARRLYRNKLRYVVARWGWSTHILAWELWNEIGSETDATVAWHREMADYLHNIDPWYHPVTTSSWCSDPADNARTFAALDIVQLHYAGLDAVAKAKRLFPGKPIIIGEGPWSLRAAVIAAYGSPLLGAAGPPLTWHGGRSSPVEKGGFYELVGALVQYWRDFPAGAARVDQLRVAAASAVAENGARYAPVTIRPGFNTWLKRATQSEFVVPPNGRVDTSGMSNRLYGTNPDRRPYRNPPHFIVDYPTDGEFAVRVGECSGPAVLVIKVDGREVLRWQVPGSGRRHPPADQAWQRVRVPRGRHEIAVDNAGHDWMAVGPFVLTNYRPMDRYPPVRVAGICAGGQARVWVFNEWAEAAASIGAEPAPPLRVRLRWRGLPDGRWSVQWLDPKAGAALSTDWLEVRRGTGELTCVVPDMAVARLRLMRKAD